MPHGQTVIVKRSSPRPEGYKLEVEYREAKVILQIFKAYRDGVSIRRIVRILNEDGVLGRNNLKMKMGSHSTISRILENEKYIGKWVWNKTEIRHDPTTGRRRRFPKPESEWITNIDESLRIIPRDIWESVQNRRQSSKKAWAGQKGKRGFSANQASRGVQCLSDSLAVRSNDLRIMWVSNRPDKR